jgi:hypothetical protein
MIIPLQLSQTGGGAMVTILVIFNIIVMLAIVAICIILFVPSVNSFVLSKDNSLSLMFPTMFIDNSSDDDSTEEETTEEETTEEETTEEETTEEEIIA